jgi:hypothetical protein
LSKKSKGISEVDAKRLAEKLFAFEAGRKAISEMIGMEIVDKGPGHKKPIVAVLMPCYDAPEPLTVKAFAEMVKASREYAAVYDASSLNGSSVVHWTRNQLLANLIQSKKPWDYVLFMDDDIVPAPDSLIKLLGHGKDIIGAVCTKRIDPPVPNIRLWEESTGNFKEILDWRDDGLLEVGAVGTGMILLSRHALEQVAEVWFDALVEKEVYGISDETAAHLRRERLAAFDENGNAWWFRFLPHIQRGHAEYGEDMSFCLAAARYCGLGIWCDTNVRPGHLGKYPYSVNDFLPYQREVIARAMKEGRVFEQENREKIIIEP